MKESIGANMNLLKAARAAISPKTDGELWVRILFLFVLANIVGIALSLSYFFNVRAVGNQITTEVTELPEVKDVDRDQVTKVLSAFSVREALFQRRTQEGVSIPNPY